MAIVYMCTYVYTYIHMYVGYKVIFEVYILERLKKWHEFHQLSNFSFLYDERISFYNIFLISVIIE